MSEEITIERQEAAKEVPSRLKGGPSPVKKLLRRAVPVLAVLAVLGPTGVAVGLEASLTRTKAELSQLQQWGRVQAADGGTWYQPGA